MTSVTAEHIAAIPKVHLHVHFVGSMSKATVRELAKRHGVALADLPGGEEIFPERFDDFPQFVDTYVGTSALVKTPEDVHLLAKNFATEQRDQGVAWAEVTVTARTLVQAGVEPKHLWSAISAGFDEVDGIDIGIIVDTIRHDGPEAFKETMSIILAADTIPLVGLGFTGIEGSVHESEFPLRAAADDLDVGLTVHAGEAGDPERIRAAIDVLETERIGHGIAAAQEPELMKWLAENETPIEVCPTSNVQLQFVESLDVHPLKTMVDAGLNVSINADDPHIFNSTLNQELGHAARMLEWSVDDLIDSQSRALEASFAPRAIWSTVREKLDTFTAAHAGS